MHVFVYLDNGDSFSSSATKNARINYYRSCRLTQSSYSLLSLIPAVSLKILPMARLSNSRRGVTFILSAAVLAAFFAAPTVYASVDVAGNEAAHLAHARHHGRMIRKRSPLLGLGDDHTTTTATSTVAASTPLASPTTSTTSSVASTTSSGVSTFFHVGCLQLSHGLWRFYF